jgi:protein-S-isoprenylcysteine O-methyltransferase Ste14
MVALCCATALLAVAANVLVAQPTVAVRREERSPFAMVITLAFFGILGGLLGSRLGKVPLPPRVADLILDAGLALLVVGTVVNVLGRLTLGDQGGKRVILGRDHAFIAGGVYRWVRHPLYASLAAMACGAAMIFANAGALAVTLFLFLPAMIHIARREEAVMEGLFPGYADYRRRTGMLLPRPWRR